MSILKEVSMNGLSLELNKCYVINYHGSESEQYVIKITNLRIDNLVTDNDAMCDFVVLQGVSSGDNLISAGSQRFKQLLEYNIFPLGDSIVCDLCNRYCKQQCKISVESESYYAD